MLFAARHTNNALCGLFLMFVAVCMLGCSATSKVGTTTPTPTPSPTPTPTPSPSYPSIPPEQITWTNKSKIPAPTAEDPANTQWANGADDFPLTVSNPTANASVTSPLTVQASATPTNPIFFMRVYVDDVSVYYTASNSIDTQIFAAPGAHSMIVMAEDTSGYISAIPINITVSSQSQAAISGIQTMSGWQSCSADFPANSQRAGQLCAAGNTNVPSSSMTEGISSPSMDGKSAQFSMSPPGGVANATYGYSNYLYFDPIAGGNGVSNFTYDLYFAIDHPDYPQALEFDVNQGFDDTTQPNGGNPIRYTWGSECNLKGDTPPGQWDIWNDSEGVWEATGIPCQASQFQPNAWNHLTWNLHRSGNYVYYDTLTVNGVATPVNKSYLMQSGWTLEEIDTAFQMDLDEAGDPYNVWLDEVSLTAY